MNHKRRSSGVIPEIDDSWKVIFVTHQLCLMTSPRFSKTNFDYFTVIEFILVFCIFVLVIIHKIQNSAWVSPKMPSSNKVKEHLATTLQSWSKKDYTETTDIFCSKNYTVWSWSYELYSVIISYLILSAFTTFLCWTGSRRWMWSFCHFG